MAISNDEVLRELFGEFFLFLENRSYVFGQIGVIQDSSPLIYVPGKSRQYVLVRAYSAAGVSVTEAINTEVVPELDLWVKMRPNEEGILEIKSAATSQALASVGTNAPNLSIGPHSHRLGITGLEDLVEGRRLEPGGVYIDDARGKLWIKVNKLHHSAGLFRGGSVNMDTYLPDNLTQKRWVKIGLDKDLNQLEFVQGSLVSIGTILDEGELHQAAFNFTGSNVIPLAAIVIRGNEGVFSRSSRFVDLRYWASGLPDGIGGGGSSFTGLEHWEADDTFGVSVSGLTEVYFEDWNFTYDTDGFEDVINTDRSEIATGGRYHILVDYSLDQDTGTNGWNRVEVEVVKNGANTPLFDHTGHINTGGDFEPSFWSFGRIVDLEVGDYVRVRAQRTNGVDTIAVGLLSCRGILIDPD